MSYRVLDLTDFELIDMPSGPATSSAVPTLPNDRWLAATIPGGVHESLLAAGRIENPYYGDNERKSAWIEDRDWWYRTRFSAPATVGGDRIRLVFDGLDTVADIWLNGTHLGHHENQFRSATFDITSAIEADNEVLVRFSPPLMDRQVPPGVAEELNRIAALFGAGPGSAQGVVEEGGMLTSLPRATTLRKAAFSWGWDFGPNVPSLGIWRPARIEIGRRAELAGHQVVLADLTADSASATVLVRLEAEIFDATAVTARVRLVSPAGVIVETELDLSAGPNETTVNLSRPELWWTHDLGEQPLYDVTVELRADGDVVDQLTDRIGLRLLELERGAPGNRRFQFVLNHVPLFSRGAAWLPASTLVGSVAETTYRDRVLRAREGNLNMLRVWGGGIYEHDAFYAACDELGVLIWQDFMFACIDYPDELPELRDEVEQEAFYQVRRLRNRASLALWAGNNEVHVLHLAAFQNVDEGGWGWHFFHEILPAAVAAHDGRTPYWPGSPYGEDNGILSINGTDDGDRHTWEVWHGLVIPGMTIGPDEYPSVGDARHYRRYAYDTARFVSEFGIHASPELATLERWLPADQLRVHSAQFDLHNKDNPKNKGDELLSVTTGLPSTMEEYIAFTQAVQAEGMAFALEHYRRRQPETSGALMWQFNDVWPGFSWSIIDFDGTPKAAYYAARRACSPLAVSFRDGEDGSLEVWLVNNQRVRASLEIDVELGSFDGTSRSTNRIAAAADAGTSVCVHAIPPSEVPRDPRHYAWASSPTGTFASARKHFDEIGRLDFGLSALEVVRLDDGLLIRSTGYSYQVRITQPIPDMRLTDNCFDLRDGDEITVIVQGADPTGLEVSSYPRAAATKATITPRDTPR